MKNLIASSNTGCHLCTILWQELEIEDYAKSAVEYLKTKLETSDEIRAFKFTVLRFPDNTKQRRYNYRLDVQDYDSSSRIGILGLKISSPGPGVDLDKLSASQAPRTDSFHHMKLLKQWLHECSHTHKSCSRRIASPKDVPKRVLDLKRVNVDGIVRLREPRKRWMLHVRYTALSYCWGQAETFKLTSTTRPTLHQGVHVSALPRTVQDGIRVTLAINVRYLWVDALCIQQDSISDWNEEAKNMMSIYSNSLLTIAGTGATSCDQGLFGLRDPLVYLPCPLFDLDDGHQVSASVSFSPLISWHSFAALHGRGWVVQERLLAPRTVNFGVCAVWECREKLASDCTMTKDDDVGQTDTRKRFAELVLAQDNSESHQRTLMKLWYIVLAQYTGSALSRKSDRLAAINGIMPSFQRQGLTPWFGLWKPLTIWELLWSVPIAYYNDTARGRGPDLNDFPTWSWAHINLDVTYELLPYQAPYDDIVYHADISGNDTCDCRDHAFRCEQRKIFLTAPLLNVEIRASEAQFQKLNRVSQLVGAEVEDSSTNIVWEDGLRDDLTGHHIMVLLVVRKRSETMYRCAGLVLAKSDGAEGFFQRTGVADFEISGELFELVSRAESVNLTLI